LFDYSGVKLISCRAGSGQGDRAAEQWEHHGEPVLLAGVVAAGLVVAGAVGGLGAAAVVAAAVALVEAVGGLSGWRS